MTKCKVDQILLSKFGRNQELQTFQSVKSQRRERIPFYSFALFSFYLSDKNKTISELLSFSVKAAATLRPDCKQFGAGSHGDTIDQNLKKYKIKNDHKMTKTDLKFKINDIDEC